MLRHIGALEALGSCLMMVMHTVEGLARCDNVRCMNRSKQSALTCQD